ncbi:HD domain-containing protein [uncultured Tolumonas sp.]|uniref:HD domain-containing protein n=1 Tax=uncultured Tolumonas sp. TaxID=263765 RepID=UPI0029305469|nr:HD domain-containing protein [uncultured Tolumonas sp.]
MFEDNPYIKFIDDVLLPYKDIIGLDYQAYRFHCFRVFLFSLTLLNNSQDAKNIEKLAIASAFHDLGMWTDNTFDYIKPSIALSTKYLISSGKTEWVEEIASMIENHHKVTSYNETCTNLVNIFRKADWIDVSLGFIKFNITTKFVQSVKNKYPNSGFHKRLIAISLKHFVKNPFDPLPMFKL